MNAADKAAIEAYWNEEGTVIAQAIADAFRLAQINGYTLGLARGELVGIAKGQESAASLIKGLRDLFKMTEGVEVPAGLPPMVSSDQVLDAKTSAQIRQAENAAEVRIGVEFGESGPCPHHDKADGTCSDESGACPGDAPGACKGRDMCEDLAPIKTDDQVLEDHPGVNFPGYFPLDLPFNDCEICQGFGVNEGELYGAPCMIPCTCTAGDQVKAKGEIDLVDDVPEVQIPEAKDQLGDAAPLEGEGALVCFNQGCASFDQEKGNCPSQGTIKICSEVITTKPAPGHEPIVGIGEIREKMAEAQGIAGEFDGICFRLACVNHDTKEANGCTQFEWVAECEHNHGPLDVNCGNVKCSSYHGGKKTKCYAVADMADMGRIQPVTSCGKFKAPESAPFTPTFAEAVPAAGAPDDSGEAVEWECCKLCKIADPSCSECGLIDAEIDLRNQAKAIADGKPAELPKCVNGSCTGNDPKSAAVCLRLEKEGRPATVCSAFVPVEKCSHLPARRFNDESGSLICGLCGEVIQASRRAATGDPSPAPEGDSKAAAVAPPADEKKLRLQARCTHPADFMNVIAGRGEVCTICDLVLTPESLPLFKEEAPAEAGKIVEIYKGTEPQDEPADECDHLPLDVRYTEPVKDPESGEIIGERELCGLCGAEIPEEKIAPECLHPADLRRPAPEMKNGEKIGSIVTCGGCEKVIARFDNERKPVPPELWPENGGALDAADIRKAGYRPDELKMIKAGFSLIRYTREEKKLVKTCKDPALGWFLIGISKTYADAERTLAEELKDPKLVQVTAIGQAATSKDEAKLRAAGFEFYRFEKASPGVNPKIKVGSKNWGMLAKYKDDAELGAAWKKLMKEDPLALEG